MNSSKIKGKALVTGASTGIGAVYADRLARRGCDLILVARNKTRLQDLSRRIIEETGRSAEVCPADLTNKSDLRRIEEVLGTDSEITLLVNNAGMATIKPLLDSSPDQLQNLIELNITALTRLSRAVIAPFVRRGSGGIINMASVVALATDRIDATYSASKAYVLTFTRFMDHELHDKGVQVQAVLPGATMSEIWERAGKDINQLPKENVMSAEDMVDAALAGFDRKEVVTIPALPNIKDWEAFEAARIALAPNLSHAKPAERYLERSLSA